MLKKAKQALLGSAKLAGIFRALGSSTWRSDRLLILGYHGISIRDEHQWNPELFMPKKLLRRRFEMIRDFGCEVLDLDDAVRLLYSGSLPNKAVAITFDDGFYNFRQEALPLLKEFGYPATVYLTTYYSRYNKPVFAIAADYILWKAGPKAVNLRDIIGQDRKFDLRHADHRHQAHRCVLDHAASREYSAEEKNDLLARLCEICSIDFEAFCRDRLFQLMDENEAADVAAEGFDVQLHTHRHRVPLDKDLFDREIIDNRAAIEQMTGRTATHFCYPSGEYNRAFFPWMRDAGIASATTCEVALSGPDTDPLLMPRLIDTCSLSDIEFGGWLSGVSAFLPQRRVRSELPAHRAN